MTQITTFSFEELIKVENFERTELTRWIERRWVLPVREGENFLFTEVDAARARLLHTLGHDMDFDDDTVDLLLSLIDEIHELRTGLSHLRDAIHELPASARRDLIAQLGASRKARSPREPDGPR